MGIFIDQRGPQTYFFHGGTDAGFRAIFYGSLTSGNGVVVMINSDNGDILAEVVNSVARVYNWEAFYQPVTKSTISLPADKLDAYVGEYRASEFLGQSNVFFQLNGKATVFTKCWKAISNGAISPNRNQVFCCLVRRGD